MHSQDFDGQYDETTPRIWYSYYNYNSFNYPDSLSCDIESINVTVNNTSEVTVHCPHDHYTGKEKTIKFDRKMSLDAGLKYVFNKIEAIDIYK